MKHLEFKIFNLKKALSRLYLAIARSDSDEGKVDICVKRFEFTYECCWKAMQSYLHEEDVIVKSPKETFEKSVQYGMVEHPDIWLQMKADRNDTSHEYDEQKAMEICNRVPQYAKEFKIVLDKLESKVVQ